MIAQIHESLDYKTKGYSSRSLYFKGITCALGKRDDPLFPKVGPFPRISTKDDLDLGIAR